MLWAIYTYEIKFLLHISRQTQVPRRKVIIVTVYHRRPCHYFPCRLDKWDDYLSPFDMCFYAINCVWKFFSEIKNHKTKRQILVCWFKESKYESMVYWGILYKFSHRLQGIIISKNIYPHVLIRENKSNLLFNYLLRPYI